MKDFHIMWLKIVDINVLKVVAILKDVLMQCVQVEDVILKNVRTLIVMVNYPFFRIPENELKLIFLKVVRVYLIDLKLQNVKGEGSTTYFLNIFIVL